MQHASRAISILITAGVAITALWSAGVPQPWLSPPSVKPQPQSTPQAQPAQLSPHQEPSADSTAVKRLLLFATAPGRNVHEGAAQLGTDGSNPQTYAAGALLENGSTLKEIHADHVVLQRDGFSSELFVIGAVNPPSGRPSNDALVQVLDTPEPRLLSNASPPTYTQILRAAPRFENELIVGFEIQPGARGGEFARLGLRRGDLLVGIDGVPLTSVDALNAALKDLAEGRAMTATVTRDGSELTVLLDHAASPAHASALTSLEGAAQ
jgi:type II secretion system protein C